MSLIINPGSGPVDGTSVEYATTNMASFLDDLSAMGHKVEAVGTGIDQGDGRWRFTVLVNGRSHEVDMPGLPRERVRFMDEDGQNIWNFPRLYVDGSSWIWCYALGVMGHDDE